MSANTGVAPHCQTALAVAMNDSDGTITSSPGPTPDAYSARWSAVVQLVVATASGAPTRSREGPLELLNPRSLRQPARIDDLGYGFGLAAAKPRPCKRDFHHEAARVGSRIADSEAAPD